MRGRQAIGSAIILGLLAAAPASASFTVGSSLRQRANLYVRCARTCTDLQSARPGSTALRIPVTGVLTRWRLRAATLGTVRLRVVRPLPDGSYATVGLSDAQKLAQDHRPGEDVQYTFDARIAVQEGDQIALDHSPTAGGVFHSYGQDSSYAALTFAVPLVEPLTPGAARPTAPAVIGRELLLNADVERDTDSDGFGDETQDNCPSIANDQKDNPCPAAAGPAPPSGGGETPGAVTVGGGTGSGSAGPPLSGEPGPALGRRGHGGKVAPRDAPSASEPGPSGHGDRRTPRPTPSATTRDASGHARKRPARRAPRASTPSKSGHGRHPVRVAPRKTGSGKRPHRTHAAPRKSPTASTVGPTSHHGARRPPRAAPQTPAPPTFQPHRR